MCAFYPKVMVHWLIQQSFGYKIEGNARFNTPSTQSATPSGAVTPATSDLAEVSCRHCTFANAAGAVNCEMCGLPLNE